jgi:lysophospholipase L1-like esterase
MHPAHQPTQPASGLVAVPERAAVPPWASFAALGDSFTEGLDDELPDGSYRGWADMLAVRLAAQREAAGRDAVEGPFRYSNLAIRGRLLPQILAQQVPVVLRQRPALVSVVGGVNDMMRPGFDVAMLERLLDDAVARLQDAGSEVVLLTGVNPTKRSRLLARLLPRVHALNDAVRGISERRGTLAVDLFDVDVFDDPRMWAMDRLHLSTEGHQRVAAAYLEALGYGDDSWRQPLEPEPALGRVDRWRDDVSWFRVHFAPWVGRRARGASSGEGILPKRPHLEPLLPSDNHDAVPITPAAHLDPAGRVAAG